MKKFLSVGPAEEETELVSVCRAAPILIPYPHQSAQTPEGA